MEKPEWWKTELSFSCQRQEEIVKSWKDNNDGDLLHILNAFEAAANTVWAVADEEGRTEEGNYGDLHSTVRYITETCQEASELLEGSARRAFFKFIENEGGSLLSTPMGGYLLVSARLAFLDDLNAFE